MNYPEVLEDWFGENNYRELDIGERILIGDVFIQESIAHTATDIGNGLYTAEHFPHFRLDI